MRPINREDYDFSHFATCLKKKEIFAICCFVASVFTNKQYSIFVSKRKIIHKKKVKIKWYTQGKQDKMTEKD